MSTFSDSIKEFINVGGLSAKIKALQAELPVLKTLQKTLGLKRRGRPAGSTSNGATPKKGKRRGKRGAVKGSVLAYLQKNKQGKASEIAKSSGLKIGSINHVLFAFKKDGTVTQSKKRGSPFVFARK